MIGIQLTLTQLRIVTEFLAKLKTFNFNINAKELSNIQIPGRLVSKNECLDLLRTLPSLKGEQFKNDLALASYLRVQESKDHLKFVLGGLDPKQSLEIEEALKKVVQEQTVAAETAGDEGVPAEQAGTAGPATSAPSGNLPFSSMPAGGSTYTPPRRVFIVENAGGKEGGTGQGTAVTNKNKTSNPVGGMGGGTGQGTAVINKINAAEAAKSEVPKAFQNAFKDEPDYKLDPTINKPGTTPTPKPGLKSQARFTNTLKSFGTKAGRGIASVGNKWFERANPILKKAGNGLARSLSSIANPGGMGGGTGSRSLFGRLGRFGRGGGSTISSTAQAAKKGKGLLFLLGILGFMTLVGGLAIVGTDPTKPIPTTPITTIGGDISSCKFTRGGDSVKELTYKSPLLLGYIQEASNLTGIPPAVLAAFIRVETPSTVSKDDDEIKALSSVATCPRNPTSGALGVMQLQPKGTTGHDEGSITNGARLIGKKYEDLTEEDYCDVRKNIIMGAGFMLKKMSYKTPDFPIIYGDGSKWDLSWTNDQEAIKKLVNGYYGCLIYGGPDPQKCEGPHNYGTDVWTSIQSCQATTSASTTTRPPAPAIEKSKLRDSLVTQFGITMNGFDEEHLHWAWEKLWEVSSTNFIALTRGSVIVQDSYSEQVGCPGPSVAVYLNQYPETLFKYALIHELGHVIRNCNKTSVSKFSDHLNALDKETGVTYYANNSWSCTGSDIPSEDYAEMISLYLNPNANIQLVKCAPANTKYTNLATDFPLHYNVAKAILGAY